MAPEAEEGWPDHWPRPSRLLANPEPIETVALLPDQPPVTFTWRGTRRRVKRADGPERVFGEWWKRDAELTLRDHPLTFLREDLRQRRIVTCADAMGARDRKWLETAGLVLVRQRPGSAKGIMFITIEDETGITNLVIWPTLYERQRRIILGAGMMAVKGPIQREGDVVHLVAHNLTDLSGELAGIGEREAPFPLPHGRGDEFHHYSPTPDPRDLPPKGLRTRDIYIPDLHIDTISVKTRDFR
jgi:error-prone DNA polymerase